MKKYKHHTLKEYSDVLSLKTPTPGGGSAAAYAAALGVALLSMVANYSKGKSSSPAVEAEIRRRLKINDKLRRRLLDLVDLDAQAYLKVVKTRKSAPAVRQKALKAARAVPLEVSQICYQAMDQAPFLVAEGNKHLLSDVEVAGELLLAAFRSAMINVKINQ